MRGSGGEGEDIRVGRNVSRTQVWNGIGGGFDGYAANFGQSGVSLKGH